MHIIQQLTPDLYEKWNEFVIRSPQGGLYQTTDWVKMLCETDEQSVNYMPLVCVEDNDILGGILVRYRVSSGKKIADLPPFGYNGPAFSPKLHDPERRHTYKTYTIFSELLKTLTEQLDYVTLENQPDIWDARAYKYNSWRIEVSFTHVWNTPNLEAAWNGICPDLQRLIQTTSECLSFQPTLEKQYIHKFIELTSPATKEIPANSMSKRIEWMLTQDRCRLFIASDKSGQDVGLVLVILSRENHTAYLWDAVCVETNRESALLPYLYFQSFSALADQFCSMDLGRSNKHTLNQVKDKLGCKLTPTFIARYPTRK